MSTHNQDEPVGYINERGDPVLLPEKRGWQGRDKEYERALQMAKQTYGNSLLYAGCVKDADPIPTAQSPFFVVMSSTCSGANPVIMERCMDPDTGAIWEREIADLPTTHTERPEEEDSGPIGTFNERPERFELYRSGDMPPEEVFAITGTMAAAPVMLGAIEAVLRSFAYAPGAGPEWFEACRAAQALATTPYVPTPDINRA